MNRKSRERRDPRSSIRLLITNEHAIFTEPEIGHILAGYKVKCLNILLSNDKRSAICRLYDQSDVYRILNEKGREYLALRNLKPLEPNWIRPAKTIFLYEIPSPVINHSDQEIINTIHYENNNKIKINQLYIIKNQTKYGQSNTIKIILEKEDEVEYAMKQGINIYGLYIPPNMIEREEHIFLKQCFKCFSYEHVTNMCHTNQKCNACGGNHHFNICTNKQNPKCLQCNGEHFANSIKCPKRKDVLKQIRQVKQMNIEATQQKKIWKNPGNYQKQNTQYSKVINYNQQYPKLPKPNYHHKKYAK